MSVSLCLFLSPFSTHLLLREVSSRAEVKCNDEQSTRTTRKPLDQETLAREHLEAVAKGCENLEKHIENVLLHGVPPIVVINRFPTDTPAEIELIKEKALAAGATAAVTHEVWAKGGEGAIELAEAVVEATKIPTNFHHLYPLDLPLQ